MGGGSTNPSATGTATSVAPGGNFTLSGTITAGANPASATYTVSCNLTMFSAIYAVPGSVTPGTYVLPCTVTGNVPRTTGKVPRTTGNVPRTGNFNISLSANGATPNFTLRFSGSPYP